MSACAEGPPWIWWQGASTSETVELRIAQPGGLLRGFAGFARAGNHDKGRLLRTRKELPGRTNEIGELVGIVVDRIQGQAERHLMVNRRLTFPLIDLESRSGVGGE